MDGMIWCFSNTSFPSRISLEWRATMGQQCSKSCFEEIDPTASVNVELHCQAIEGAKLQEHKGNVINMCKSTESHFQAIVENGHAYDAETYMRHILDALLSGPNYDFNTRM